MRAGDREGPREAEGERGVFVGNGNAHTLTKKNPHTMNENGSVFTFDSVSEFSKFSKHFT